MPLASGSVAVAENSPCISSFPGHLKILRQLGRGAYGTVHLCEDTRQPGVQVAVKHIKQAAGHGKNILREIRLLARLTHENLLHILDFPELPGPDFEDVFLVLPYLPTDLSKLIQSKQSLTDRHVQVIVCQMCRALAHLHAAGVAHRDLKPANVLLTADCRLKICDFGLARGGVPDPETEADSGCVLTEYVVTRWYRAPEVMLLPRQYSTALDLWAVGCILCEILGREAVFPGRNHVDMIKRITQVLGTPSDVDLEWLPKDSDAYRFVRDVCPESSGTPLQDLYPMATPECLDFASGLLQWDPSQRLSAAEAQEHEYISAFLPGDPPAMPDVFDWAFDSFKPTSTAVKTRLYQECALFHPEISERDRVKEQRLTPKPPSARKSTLCGVPSAPALARPAIAFAQPFSRSGSTRPAGAFAQPSSRSGSMNVPVGGSSRSGSVNAPVGIVPQPQRRCATTLRDASRVAQSVSQQVPVPRARPPPNTAACRQPTPVRYVMARQMSAPLPARAAATAMRPLPTTARPQRCW